MTHQRDVHMNSGNFVYSPPIYYLCIITVMLLKLPTHSTPKYAVTHGVHSSLHIPPASMSPSLFLNNSNTTTQHIWLHQMRSRSSCVQSFCKHSIDTCLSFVVPFHAYQPPPHCHILNAIIYCPFIVHHFVTDKMHQRLSNMHSTLPSTPAAAIGLGARVSHPILMIKYRKRHIWTMQLVN